MGQSTAEQDIAASGERDCFRWSEVADRRRERGAEVADRRTEKREIDFENPRRERGRQGEGNEMSNGRWRLPKSSLDSMTTKNFLGTNINRAHLASISVLNILDTL